MTTTVLAYIPSPAQGVWQIGPVPLRAYALFIIIGIVAALVIGDRRWEARGGERGVIYDIALWAVPFGLIGGRLYHVITDWWRYFGDGGAGLAGVFRIWDGGLGIWGAVALGGVGAWIGCRRRGIPLPAFGDAIAPGIILAQAIGRIGNYFNQELWGGETTLPWGLKIYERRDATGAIDNLNGVSTGEVLHIVHPTFLYELLWNLLVFAALIYLDRRFKLGHGRVFALYVAGYCLGRFWIELLRVDDATLIDGVRINSFTSTFVFIGAVVYVMVAPKGREDPATLQGKPREDQEPEVAAGEGVAEELAAVGATAGVVAAAKVAAEDEDEDAEAAAGEQKSEAAAEAETLTADIAIAPSDEITEAEEFAEAGAEADESEVAAEAEALGADVAGVPADNLAEAEEFAAEGDEQAEAQSEAAAEAEALADDVEEAPSEDIAEAEAFAEAGEDAEPAAAVGTVEGEEALDAEVAAPEAHEAAVEGLEEAEEVAAEVDAEAEAAEEVEAEAAEEPDAEAEPEDEGADSDGEVAEAETGDSEGEEAEPVAGVGAVEGEEAVEAEVAAPEAHEAAVEEAEEVAAEIDAEAEAAADEDEPEADEVEVEEAVEADEVAAEEVEAEPLRVESPDIDEPMAETPVREQLEAEPISEPTEQSGGRLRRWFRGRRNS